MHDTLLESLPKVLKYTNLGILGPLMRPTKVSVIGFLLERYNNFRIKNVLVGSLFLGLDIRDWWSLAQLSCVLGRD